jgi:hypothetical protein
VSANFQLNYNANLTFCLYVFEKIFGKFFGQDRRKKVAVRNSYLNFFSADRKRTNPLHEKASGILRDAKKRLPQEKDFLRQPRFVQKPTFRRQYLITLSAFGT